VNHTGRAANGFPGAEPCGQPLAAFVLDEHVKIALQHEEALLDLVGVSGVTLTRFDVHDREGEVAGRDDRRIGVLAGAAGADETVLGALEAFDLGIFERGPIRLLLLEAADIALHDVFD
jgi:hypothetical protein